MTTAQGLSHSLERSVLIHASPDTVFRFFTDTDRWASWWGAGSSIDPRPGGRVFIRHPEGTEVAGTVVEISTPTRIVFSYGFVTGTPIPEGASLVSIRLEPQGGATRLHLSHDFSEPHVRDEHVQGWRYQLSLFGNIVANEAFAGAGDVVDGWFDAWSEPDAAKREALLSPVVSPDVRFRDRFSLTDGLPDLLAQLAAVHRFMPGMRLRREGEVRHCQGTVVADWVAVGASGDERGRGTNVFQFGAGARIEAVTGLWEAPKRPG